MPDRKSNRYMKKLRKKGSLFKRRRPNKRKYNNTMVIRGPSVVPDSTYVKLHYYDVYTIQAGAIGSYQMMRGNGLFDPDQTGSGHQPLGRDQWSNFYTKYQVVGSKCIARFSGNQSNLEAATLVVVPVDATPPVPDLRTLVETPYSKSAFVSGSNTSGRSTMISNYISTKAKLGYDNIDQVEETISNRAANPGEQWYWAVGIQNTSATTQTYFVAIEMIYYVKFLDRIDLVSS